MAAADLKAIVNHCDRELRVEAIADSPGAHNGLQVENSGKVRAIAAAVDASLATVQKSAMGGASLMVVHHGLFWTAKHPWIGPRRKLIQTLVEHDMAVYSAHLPLDLHPRLGNNALLCKALKFTRPRPFFEEHGTPIGLRVSTRLCRDILAARLKTILGVPPVLLRGGPSVCKKIGIVTGGAGGSVEKAAKEGVDTFITGEGPHWTGALAEELGINIYYGGHYATETFGVKALAKHLSRKFRVPWEFVDHPTGL
ncbi:MAG: Nif3-like dinuclear metal center hexameric protein [Verrucomicrobiales bacterium]|nr:Nif3-like dinuclear metal center hexameric protein [Verrucomicrobiales bacterium]MBL68873.1 Nif3-like dinuclear metal center hexameric protein [Verrucomicrobiales bacterium]